MRHLSWREMSIFLEYFLSLTDFSLPETMTERSNLHQTQKKLWGNSWNYAEGLWGIPKTTNSKILTENLEITRVREFIWKVLMAEQKNLRFEMSYCFTSLRAILIQPPETLGCSKDWKCRSKDTGSTTNRQSQSQGCFRKWKHWWETVVQTNGDYLTSRMTKNNSFIGI